MKTNIHPAIPKAQIDQWSSLAELQGLLSQKSNCVIIDRKVARLHRFEADSFLKLSAGERIKSFSSLKRICRYIQDRRLSGAEKIYAVGGGTVGDVSALAAHMVKRGMPLIHVPTTLLSAVDSSIGGKAAINDSRGGKNVFGAFHFPEKSILVEQIWSTLTRTQLREGIAEALKMILCLDADQSEKCRHERLSIVDFVRIGRRLKSEVCRVDPFETGGLRHKLNFGHTIGHVLETLTSHRISHGMAVAMGMRAALAFGAELNICDEQDATLANDLLNAYNLPTIEDLSDAIENFAWPDFLSALKLDKKGFLQFVLLRKPGKAILRAVDTKTVKAFFDHWKNL